jgi:tripartite-type tricarboxylate transporter receptor subunit TctC
MRIILLRAAAALCLSIPLGAAAQAYPAKPVRMIIPFPPGGATDIIGRLVGTKMQEVWGQPVVLESRPGAGTVVGTDAVAKSAPDGYTMAFVVTAHVINPSLRENMPYDTLKDLSGVTQVSQQHIAVAAYPGFEANSIAELIAIAKKDPGKIAYATSGAGTALHLSMELLGVKAGVKMTHVPYKGGAQAAQDVLGGRVPILMDIHYALAGYVKGGKLKVLALMSDKHPAYAKEYPLVAETVPGVSALSIVGLVVPSATPRDIVHKASADIARAVRNSDLTERMVAQGMEPVGSTPEEFDALVRVEIAKWAPVVKASGAKAD